jgi:Leucine-rich repeat (LRR) protein
MEPWIQEQFESIRDSAFETRVLRMNRKHIRYLEWIPTRCEELHLEENRLTRLPDLSNSVKILNVSKNDLNKLPGLLPQNLQFLDVSDNPHLTSLPELPETLEVLRASNCALTSLPTLPKSLRYLYLQNNYLSELPELPPHLEILYIFNNCIQDYNKLPSTIQKCVTDQQNT